MKVRTHVVALFLLAPAAATFTALPATALAQDATPELISLQVTSDNGVNPGSRLRFTLRGTPGSRALVRIRGVRGPIELTERSRGVYTGRYVVAAEDRIEPGDPIRATLRRGNRTVTASYDVPADIGNVAAQSPRIERFEMAQVDRIEPGTELRFRLDAAPGATAFVDLPGIERNVPMREMRPGHYEGSYTIRRSDRLDPSAPIVAKLRTGDRVLTANLDRPVVAAAQPAVQIQVLSPGNNVQVDGNATLVRGRTAPFADVNVRVDAVPPVVGQFGVAREVLARTVRADARGYFEFTFNSPLPIPGTRYEVAMTASKADVTSEAHLVLYQRQG